MKKWKKALALMLMGVMLCGNALTVLAEEPATQTNETEDIENGDNPISTDEDGSTDDSSTESDSTTTGNTDDESGSDNEDTFSIEESLPAASVFTSELENSAENNQDNNQNNNNQDNNNNQNNNNQDNNNQNNNNQNNNNQNNNNQNDNNQSSPSDQYASDEWKDHIRFQLNHHYSDLKMRYKLTDEKIKRMDKIYNSAMTYMKNAELTMSELTSYEAEVEGYLDEIAKETFSGTEKFLMLSNEVPIISAEYGEHVFVVLSLINLGKTDITNVVITPTISNDMTKWPFDIDQAYDAQTIQMIQSANNTEDAYNKRMDIGWHFNVREDVLTGCYPLVFHANYYQNGALVETDITTYINVKGADPKRVLIKDPYYTEEEEEEEERTANPRIIVTGYRTDPEEVFAGSTFNLTVSVKNTSRETAVENVLFNMEATVEGKDADATYAAFLPTSGSSSVYKDRIAPGETYDMSIEMEAKSDLSQKPYVLTVNMKYDTEKQINLSDVAHVSIPIKQEAKLDTGTAEVMPESIAVGDQSNVMFSIFNTGKTTLFNVKVTYESDTVDSGITYLGNISPGSTGNVDSMLTGIAPDMGEGIVKAVVTYEDEAGNESRYEKDLNLYVYEMTFDDDMMGDYPMDPIEEEPEQKGLPMIAIIGIVAAVIVVIVIIIVVISKKRKAKKHKEDMDLLDEDDIS